MNNKSYIVFPLRRIAAAVYDIFLLLGVWFLVGSIGVWINGGIIENKFIGPILVLISTWAFYIYFWTHGGKTLGMAVWNFEIYSLDNKKIGFKKASIRFAFNLITVLLCGLPLILIYLTEKSLSLSDYFSKTSYRKI